MVPKVNLTENFKLQEFYRSDVADRLNHDNYPPSWAFSRLRFLATVLQEFRDYLTDKYEEDTPIIITSGYRSKYLNKHLPGASPNSHHVEALAADFVVPGFTCHEIISAFLECGAEFDQIINEYDRWIHLSVHPKNRHQILQSRKNVFGKKTYEKII